MAQVETSDLIRLSAGHVSTSTILGDSNALITNFPIQSDAVYPYWLAYLDGGITNGVNIQSLAGDGKNYGKMSGALSFALMTPDMMQYLYDNVFTALGWQPVTIYCFHQRYKEVTINCYMEFPSNIADIATQQTDTKWTNVGFIWNRGVISGNAFSSGFSSGFS